MSKILKKITKKYKWLRFLNYKTTKLAVLSAALFGLCLSSGASFAKYRDENYGGGDAGVVKFEYGTITPYSSPIQEPQKFANTKGGIHVFPCEFKLEIPTVETSISYSVKLRLVNINEEVDFEINDSGLEYTSFVPENDNNGAGFHFFYEDKSARTDADKIKTDTKLLGVATNENVTYKAGHWYKGTKDDENKAYSFEPKNTVLENDAILFDEGIVEAGESLTKYFKVFIFIDAQRDSSKWDIESSKVLYNYKVDQVVL